jgi:hypothetical protein
MEKSNSDKDLIARRKVIIKTICDKLQSPGLVWAFNDPFNESIGFDLIADFRSELLQTFTSLAKGIIVPLPNNTDPHHLPAFVAIDKPKDGALALYNLGYRPSWESPVLKSEKYEVKFYMPNATTITFLTGPNGGFSVFSLWLDMRIICAEKDGKRSTSDPTSIITVKKEAPDSKNDNFLKDILGDTFGPTPKPRSKPKQEPNCTHQ